MRNLPARSCSKPRPSRRLKVWASKPDLMKDLPTIRYAGLALLIYRTYEHRHPFWIKSMRCSAHSCIDQASGAGLNVHCAYVKPLMAPSNPASEDFNSFTKYLRSLVVMLPSAASRDAAATGDAIDATHPASTNQHAKCCFKFIGPLNS